MKTMERMKPKVVNNFSVIEIMAKIIHFLHELGNTVGNFTSADNEKDSGMKESQTIRIIKE